MRSGSRRTGTPLCRTNHCLKGTKPLLSNAENAALFAATQTTAGSPPGMPTKETAGVTNPGCQPTSSTSWRRNLKRRACANAASKAWLITGIFRRIRVKFLICSIGKSGRIRRHLTSTPMIRAVLSLPPLITSSAVIAARMTAGIVRILFALGMAVHESGRSSGLRLPAKDLFIRRAHRRVPLLCLPLILPFLSRAAPVSSAPTLS